jgi:short-subunit dehydrogenase
VKAADARVLLTGAGGGIGEAMARTLAGAGASLLLVGRSAERLAAQARSLGPARAEWVRADLSQLEGIAAVAEAAARWRANVVVHAAGLPCFGSLDAVPAAQMAAVLQTNLLAPMLLTQALLPQLRRQPRAQVVFVGSAVGSIGLPGFAVYGASKAGLQRFAEALRRELADTPVRVQLLGPRSTRTAFNDAGVEAYNAATGTAMDSPEAVAAALLALIESEAAERYLGFPERFAVRLNGLLGALLDGSFVRHRRSLDIAPLQPASRGTP